MDQKSLQSENLLLRYKAGDQQAINLLLNLWHTRIYNLAFKMLADHDTAMDVLQKTCIKVYEKAHQLEDSGKFKSWVYRIAVNFCNSELRKSKRDQRLVEPDLVKNKLTTNQSNSVEMHELKSYLNNALQQIPDEQRTIIVMKEYENLKFHEIAEVLDISINTAKSRLYYGLKTLRKLLINSPQAKEFYYEY